MRRRVWRIASSGVLVTLASCLYRPDDRCGEDQWYDETVGYCACNEGLVPRDQKCVPCGEFEVAVAGKCVCEDKYERNVETGVCEPTAPPAPANLGAPCNTEDQPCTGDAAYCHTDEGETEGYCTTRDCASSADCVEAQGYSCVTEGDVSYCQRSASAPATQPLDGLGAICNETDQPCTGANTFCHVEEGEDEGYCTMQDCAASAECAESEGYACDTAATPSFCKRPPSGQGQTCESDADCAGTDASYCSLYAHKCVVTGCIEDPSVVCHPDWLCCDFSSVSLPSMCIKQDALAGGVCPL